MNLTNLLTEFGNLSIFFTVSVYLFDISEENKEKLDVLLIVIVNTIIFSHLATSLLAFAQVIIAKVRKVKVEPEKINPKKRESKKFFEEEKSEISFDHVFFDPPNASPIQSFNPSVPFENKPLK